MTIDDRKCEAKLSFEYCLAFLKAVQKTKFESKSVAYKCARMKEIV